MAGDKLAAARFCAAWLAERMRTDDRLAIVSFDDTVRVDRPLHAVDAGGVDQALAAIHPGGATNLSGGWLRGAELLRTADDLSARRVILLTDGMANQGICDRPTLAGLTAGAAADGITTSTIGFGDGFDEDLLTAMADTGRGAAHYAASPEDAPAVFADEAADLADLVAQNVTVTISHPHPDTRGVEVLGGWAVTPMGDGLVIDVGDAYAGRTRRVVFALDVTGLQRLGPTRIAEVTVGYTAIGATVAAHSLTVPVTVHVASAADAERAGIDTAVREQVQLLLAAQAQERAIEAYDAGDAAGGRAHMDEAIARYHAVPAAAMSPEVRAELATLEELHERIDPAGMDPAQRKLLRYNAQARRRGR